MSIKDIIEGYEAEAEEPGGASLPVEQTLEETYRAIENKLEEEESSGEVNLLYKGMLQHSLDLLDEGYEGIKNDFNTVWNDGKDLVPWGGSTDTTEDNWTQKRIDGATRLLEIKKTQAEIKKLEAERKKIQAVTKKTLSSAKSKGKGASRAQQTTILKEIYASQRRAPEAKLKEIERRLALLGTQGIFDDDERKEIKDLNKNAMVYRDQIRKIGADYLRVEQDLAKGKSWSDTVDSISR